MKLYEILKGFGGSILIAVLFCSIWYGNQPGTITVKENYVFGFTAPLEIWIIISAGLAIVILILALVVTPTGERSEKLKARDL